MTKAASALKFVSNFDPDNEKEGRLKAALLSGVGAGAGAIDSESVHNASNHSTIYAPNNMLSSSRKHHPKRSIEALQKKTTATASFQHHLP